MFLEILEFVFENFWRWLGTLLLILAVSEIPKNLIRIIIKKQKDKTTPH